MIALLALAMAAAPVSPACADSGHRAFDFWIGEWAVIDTASGGEVAHSSIEPASDGCAIRESYVQTVGPDGKPFRYLGTSYSALSRADGAWHQFYIDSNGNATSFTGGIEAGAMVLRTDNQRMTLRTEGARVRQIGETTKDGGKNWSPGYDLTYIRR